MTRRILFPQPRLWVGGWRIVLGLLFLGFTLCLYLPTINQPYFWDDVPQFQFSTSRSLSQIWTNVTGLPYYRPLGMSIYRLLFTLLPAGSTIASHALLILLHSINSWLVGIATAQLLNLVGITKLHTNRYLGLAFGQWAELMAGLIFVTYPFAALPVSQFGSLYHPLVTFFFLLGLVATFAYLSRGQNRWFFLALIACISAPFVHESGVMAGPVAGLALLGFAASTDQSWQRKGIKLVLLSSASILFLPIWLLVPKSRGEFIWMGWQGIVASLVFFAQSFSFPLQRVSRLLIDLSDALISSASMTIAGIPVAHLSSILLVAGTALVVLCMAWKDRRGNRTILLFGLAWIILAILPNVAGLPFSYIMVSQRLLYLSGAPAAILWAVFLLHWGYPEEGWTKFTKRYRVSGAMLAFAAILWTGIWYVGREVQLHSFALAPLDQYIQIAKENPGQKILVLNPPLWINYRDAAYGLGHEGVPVSADYIDFDHLIDINSNQAADATAVTFPDIKVELDDYYYATINENLPWTPATFSDQLAGFDSVWVTEYSPDRIRVVPAGWVQNHTDAGAEDQPESYLARFGEALLLSDLRVTQENNELQLTLDWQLMEPMPDVTIFRHIVGCSNEMIAQGDGLAVGRTFPFDDPVGVTKIRDIRTFILADDAPKESVFESM